MKKQKIYFKILATIFAVFILSQYTGVKQAFAQDIHFSQFDETPVFLNPAAAGFFNGDHRAILNYKNQWQSIGNAYRTYAFSYDMPVFKKKWNNGYIGTGVFVYNDKAGDFNMNSTKLDFILSSILRLSGRQKVSAGLQGGFGQKSIDGSDVKWGNQYNQVSGVHDPNLPTGELNSYNSIAYADFATGVAWSFQKGDLTMSSNDRLSINAGIGYFHLNKPGIEYLSGNREQLYSKIVFHGSSYIGIKNTKIAFLPGLLYMQQGTSTEAVAGTTVRYLVQEGSKYTSFMKETAVQIGCFYRAGDAVIPTVKLEYSNFALGISYDITTSGLSQSARGRGGMEISLRFITPNPFGAGNSKARI